MPATFSKSKTVVSGEIILASDRNAEFDNILSNLDPTGVDDESDTDVAMQATRNPYPGQVISRPLNLKGEFQGIRHLIKQITGKNQWYIDPTRDVKGADLASASPLIIGTDGDYFDVTGTINFAVMTVAVNRLFVLQFDAILTLTHHATNLDLPGEANITTAAGDSMICFSTGANTVHVLSYTRADGRALKSDAALLIPNNLSDIANAGTARTNLGAAASGSNSDITALTALTNITPGADFTLTQNSVVPFTSVESGAVAETLKLNAGNVELAGNLVMASGKGIDFSATGDAGGMTSELLDDYEEGTWTPVLGGSGGTSGQTYSRQVGLYTKVGNLVNCIASIILTAKGTITNNLQLLGAPFTTANVLGNTPGASYGLLDKWTLTAGHHLLIHGDKIDAMFQFKEASLTGDSASVLTTTAIEDTTRLFVSFTYRV